MIDQKKFEELDWKFRESESFHCIDFKSPRMKKFEAFLIFSHTTDKELTICEHEGFMAQVRKNVHNQFDEVASNTCKQLEILARKNVPLEGKIKITIDIYP